ncbi:MAG: ABC transporter ATP-binding protein [Bacteroidia bacterium]
MQVSIQLNNISKKYINEWIFKNVSLTISPSQKMVVLGSNGSGKSTLLQTIAAFLIPTKGELTWNNGPQKIEDDLIFKHLSMASPYMELVEDFTLEEMVDHQKTFKPFLNNLSVKEVISLMQLEHAAGKHIKNYSSGMRQRVKLGLAVLADCPVLLLDEPCTNLDARSIAWYQELIFQNAMHKTILVCSNTVKEEYSFCDTNIEIENYK